jgi:secreted trypsin-like serine protease
MHHKTKIGKYATVTVLTGVAMVVAAAALRGGTHTPQRRIGIIGGVPIKNSTLPALAYVRTRWWHRVAQCTGTLVAPNAVLTAAHCVENSRTGRVAAAAQIRVLVGRLSGANVHHPGLTIGRVVVFDGSGPVTESADVALLVMGTPTTQLPILLASGDHWLGAPQAEMIGWSTDELLPRAVLDTQFSRPEKVIAQTVVQTSGWCEERVSHFNPQYDICTIDPPSYNTGGCVGASGSPLVASNMSPTVEVGMVIRGPAGCSTHRPTVFVRISAVRGWIAAQLATTSTLDDNDTSVTGS